MEATYAFTQLPVEELHFTRGTTINGSFKCMPIQVTFLPTTRIRVIFGRIIMILFQYFIQPFR